LETDDFVDNEFNTGWLDALIAGRMRSEKPPVLLGVVCASVLMAEVATVNAFQSFQNCLER
jgi:acetyl-CoA carboxylase/biotin carboxylase 2